MNTADPQLIALLTRIADALERAYPKSEPETELTAMQRAFPAWRWTQHLDSEIIGTSDASRYLFSLRLVDKSQWIGRVMLYGQMQFVTCECDTPQRAAHILMRSIQ